MAAVTAARPTRSSGLAVQGRRPDGCRHLRACFALLFLAGIVLLPVAAHSKEPPARPLPLKKIGGLDNGRLAYIAGRTTADGQRFYASNLLVTQPVRVTLKADNPADDIRLRVTKTEWSKAERELSTGAEGRVQTSFRTQGEFGVVVSGAAPGQGYRMTVWIGDEVKRPMRPVVVPRAQWKGESGSGAGSAWLMWVIAGALVTIAGLLLMLLRRRKGS